MTKSLFLTVSDPSAEEAFYIQPYLQLGEQFRSGSRVCLLVIWHTLLAGRNWQGDWRLEGETDWRPGTGARRHKMRISQLPKQWQYRALLPGIPAGKTFEYRLLKGGELLFSSSARVPAPAGENCRIAVFGDLADGGRATKKIAHSLYQSNPDAVVIAGDVVYKHGRVSEYLDNFFPVYNAAISSPTVGAPLMRSLPMVAAAGNHDIGIPKKSDLPDTKKMPDLGGYFHFWSHPANGPKMDSARILKDLGKRSRRLIEVFGKRFTSRTNFCLSLGDSYWLVLDGNQYMDWNNKALLDWVENSLQSAEPYAWKFVCVHQPPFNSDYKYWNDQRLRRLAGLFEKYGVNIVFSGHAHFYERSMPLKYKLIEPVKDNGTSFVPGLMTIDQRYDDSENTRPDGVVYVITGAGGQLVSWDNKPECSDFTRRQVIDRHSFSLLDLSPGKLVFRQLDGEGKELDCFILTREDGREAQYGASKSA